MLVSILMVLIGIATTLLLWHVLVVIIKMKRETRESIRWSFITKAAGLGTTLASVVDYFHGEPMGWPWVLLAGVALSTTGSTLLYIVNRRTCNCFECPIRGICANESQPDN